MPSTMTTLGITASSHTPQPWVSFDELCDGIEVEFGFRPCERTVIRWRKDGCPHLPLSYRRIRYQVAEVVQWLLQLQVSGKRLKQRRNLGRSLS